VTLNFTGSQRCETGRPRSRPGLICFVCGHCVGMSLGVPMAPGGMNPAVPGMPGMDATAVGGLGMPPGAAVGGLGMPAGLAVGGGSVDAAAMMALGSAPAPAAAAPPIATECLLVSNLFDSNKFVS